MADSNSMGFISPFINRLPINFSMSLGWCSVTGKFSGLNQAQRQSYFKEKRTAISSRNSLFPSPGIPVTIISRPTSTLSRSSNSPMPKIAPFCKPFSKRANSSSFTSAAVKMPSKGTSFASAIACRKASAPWLISSSLASLHPSP